MRQAETVEWALKAGGRGRRLGRKHGGPRFRRRVRYRSVHAEIVHAGIQSVQVALTHEGVLSWLER